MGNILCLDKKEYHCKITDYNVTVYCGNDFFPAYRFDDLAESVESVLLPLLTQLPSPDLYNLAPPSPSSNHTPHSTEQEHTARLAKATMDAIDNCKEGVPGYLEANDIVLDSSMRENLAKVMTTCSQLASSDKYLKHKKDKVWYNISKTLCTR